jgi:hypothetical protein
MTRPLVADMLLEIADIEVVKLPVLMLDCNMAVELLTAWLAVV